MHRVACVVFDFDGTLVDSNALKYRAWYEVLGAEGCTPNEVRELLRSHPNADRHEIIRLVLTQFKARLPTGEGDSPRAERLARLYNDICEIGQATCREMFGAEAVLKELHANIPLYLNSATPENVLQRVVKARRWSLYFRGVYGTPRTKLENLRTIAATEAILPSQIVMVGDGKADVEAARDFGCPFFGVGTLTSSSCEQYIGGIDTLTRCLRTTSLS